MRTRTIAALMLERLRGPVDYALIDRGGGARAVAAIAALMTERNGAPSRVRA